MFTSFVLLIFGLAFADPASTISIPKLGPLARGVQAPWFALGRVPDDSGVLNTTRIRKQLRSDPKRHAVVLFFADWCVACKKGIHRIAQRREEFMTRSIPLYFVDASMDGTGTSGIEYLRQVGMDDFPVAWDRYGEQCRNWGIGGGEGAQSLKLPTTVILDGSGSVRAIFQEEGDDFVDRLLQGR